MNSRKRPFEHGKDTLDAMFIVGNDVKKMKLVPYKCPRCGYVDYCTSEPVIDVPHDPSEPATVICSECETEIDIDKAMEACKNDHV